MRNARCKRFIVVWCFLFLESAWAGGNAISRVAAKLGVAGGSGAKRVLSVVMGTSPAIRTSVIRRSEPLLMEADGFFARLGFSRSIERQRLRREKEFERFEERLVLLLGSDAAKPWIEAAEGKLARAAMGGVVSEREFSSIMEDTLLAVDIKSIFFSGFTKQDFMNFRDNARAAKIDASRLRAGPRRANFTGFEVSQETEVFLQ